MNRVGTALAGAALVAGLALTGCAKPAERWCEFDNDRDPEYVVANWECESGLPDREWEPESDKPRYRFKPSKAKKPVTATQQSTVPKAAINQPPKAQAPTKAPPATKRR